MTPIMSMAGRGSTLPMRLATALPVVLLTVVLAAPAAGAQTKRKSSTRKPAKPAASALKKEPVVAQCGAELGTGVRTTRRFCDVLAAGDPASAVVVPVPPHSGTATLTFDLHNRHTYSEQEVKTGRAFAQYTAMVRVVGPDGQVLERAAVQSAFRSPADLVDRIAGGAGPGGVKAVAPLGTETITVTLPAAMSEVTLVGERLTVETLQGRSSYSSPGRPVAIVSNVAIEYRPAAAKKTPARRP